MSAFVPATTQENAVAVIREFQWMTENQKFRGSSENMDSFYQRY